MADIKQFIEDNNLKQVEIARFLGITEGSVSKMVKGLTSPSAVNLQKLLDNDRGWETASLAKPRAERNAEVSRLREEISSLKTQINDLREEKEWLKGLLEKLIDGRKLATNEKLNKIK